MKKKARGILFIENKIVLIKRSTDHGIYYVFPGGTVEDGESFEVALVREFDEELGITVSPTKTICEILDHTTNIHETFFESKKEHGEIGTGLDIKFSSDSQLKNQYEIILVEVNDLKNLNILPSTVKDTLIKLYARTS